MMSQQLIWQSMKTTVTSCNVLADATTARACNDFKEATAHDGRSVQSCQESISWIRL